MNPTPQSVRPRSPRPSRRSLVIVIVTVAASALMLMSACASAPEASDDIASLGTTPSTEGTDESVPTSVDPEDAFVAYTECMRDEGIDMPDPQVMQAGDTGSEAGHVVIAVDEAGPGDAPMVEIESDEFQAAEKLCKPILDDVMGDIEIDPEVQAEQREQMLEFSQCMRDHGIDFPDPVFSDNGSVSIGIGPGGSVPDEADREAMDDAAKECGQDGGPIAIGSKVEGGGDS